MAASGQIIQSVVFLGSATGSGGTYIASIYPNVPASKGYFTDVVCIANDTTGNNGLCSQRGYIWKTIGGNATFGGTSIEAVLVADGSFGASSVTAAGSGANAQATFTNQGTNAADVCYFVSIYEIA